MVADQFQKGKDAQANAGSKGAPSAELSCSHFDVESSRVYVLGLLCDVLASRNFTAAKFKRDSVVDFAGTIWEETYDGNLWVMSAHHTMNPRVIIMAESTVVVQAITPKRTSRKSPRKEASNSLIANIENLKAEIVTDHSKKDRVGGETHR